MASPMRIAVIGAGRMGAGFAVHFPLYGQDVTVVDHRRSNLEDARERIRDSIEFLRRRGVTRSSPDAVLDGIDLFHTVAAQLYPELDDSTEPHDAFASHERAGHTGVEAGRGFYSYHEAPDEVTMRRDDGLIAVAEALEDEDG